MQRFLQFRADRVPVTHEQLDDFRGLSVTFKGKIFPPRSGQILAGRHDVWTANQRNERKRDSMIAYLRRRMEGAVIRKCSSNFREKDIWILLEHCYEGLPDALRSSCRVRIPGHQDKCFHCCDRSYDCHSVE
jgi:hypothetical protein